MPVLYAVACGATPAAEVAGFVRTVREDGWTVCAILTPSAVRFADVAELEEATGFPVRSAYKRPDEPDVLPPADAFVVAPATFNTVNKFACGISDTLAAGLLNEGLGLGRPIVVAPWPNAPLARHPAFRRSLADLRSWGVHVVYDPDRLPGAPGSAPAHLDWTAVRAALPVPG
ncbi:flavoprotein [Actinomadura flavalba]|uniref:flavoprotein n=1 Tax=Actinomadura flavalba TaxID=1120938 RepID=UPI00037FF988|nr:flavoprotein [Actinomadura flavalba]